MGKRRVILTAFIIVALMGLILVFVLLPPRKEVQLAPESVRANSAATNLGFTYLPVTPRISAYYNLGVNSGALVTEVVPDSLVAKAGVGVGDVILSFNGVKVEEATPLLGMIMACPAGHQVVLEVWRGKSINIVEFTHLEG